MTIEIRSRQAQPLDELVAPRRASSGRVLEKLQRRGAGEIRPERQFSGEISDVRAVGRGLDADAFRKHVSGTCRRADQPQQNTNGRRLARAIGTKEPENLTFVDLEADSFEGNDRTVALGERVDANGGGHGCLEYPHCAPRTRTQHAALST